ncbi:hypothetical protein NHQ30_003964 [Ciborinia camelliae]|nr:hypothetical protein NHQ30_003964 [Ciborinia camelliae]
MTQHYIQTRIYNRPWTFRTHYRANFINIGRKRSRDPRDVVCLSFSGNPNLNEDFLREILIKFPKIELLYLLLNAPQISLSKKIDLLRGTAIRLYDTEILALSFVKVKDECSDHAFHPRNAPLYDYIKPVISQMIILACYDTGEVQRYTDGGLDIEPFFRNDKSHLRNHACIPFGGISLPPSALIAGLAQYIHYLMTREPYLGFGELNFPAQHIATHLAIPHPFVDNNENSFRVCTLPEYLCNRNIVWKEYSSKIIPGEWTLAVIGETKNWKHAAGRYAFVTAAPPADAEDTTSNSYVPEFVIEYLHGFLESTLPDTSTREQILEDWNKAVAPVHPRSPLKLSLKQEVESLMRAPVYTESQT